MRRMNTPNAVMRNSIHTICVSLVLTAATVIPNVIAGELKGEVIAVNGNNVTIQLEGQGYVNKGDKVEIYHDTYGVVIQYGIWRVSAVKEDTTIEAEPDKMDAPPNRTLKATIHATGSRESYIKQLNWLAFLYSVGSGDVEKNIPKAIELYRKVAEMGDAARAAEGLFSIYIRDIRKGGHLLKEKKSQTDCAKAFKLFLKEAKQGDYRSQYRIGQSYLFGMGVKPDLAEAEKWYRKADATCESMEQLKTGCILSPSLGSDLHMLTRYPELINLHGMTQKELSDKALEFLLEERRKKDRRKKE